MVKILFVCHGNICRSPMAEFIMKDIVRREGLEQEFRIESAATSTEEIGSDMYRPARQKLQEKGVPFTRRQARQVTAQDYQKYDLLICMDSRNITNMKRILKEDPQAKISRLLEHTAHPRDIADPWYTDDFETTYRELCEGCQALLLELRQIHGI